MASAVRALVDRAVAARRSGDSRDALALYREAAAACGADVAARAHCLRHIGDLSRELALPDDARAALQEAEALYRGPVDDTLSLANTVRLLALIDGDGARWREARALYERAAMETGFDLTAAFAECDRQLAEG